MFNSESVLENETYKILLDFKIQMDQLISARRPDLVLIGKKQACGFWRSINPQSEIKRKS